MLALHRHHCSHEETYALTAYCKPLLIAILFGLCAAASADEVNDLEEELPLTIEDASPGEPGSVQFNGGLRYQRVRPAQPGQGRNETQLTPRLQFGVTRDMQISIAAPYRLGNAADTSQGEFRLEALYRLNLETAALPSFAIEAGIERPYGAQAGGTEVLIKGIMSKSLGSSRNTDRPAQVHVNLAVRRNIDPLDEERRTRYLAGAALSKQISERFLLAASLFREQQRERTEADNMAELGARWKLSEKTILSGAIGHGFNRGAVPLRLQFGFQRSLD
jgi:hypothetical protein